ncbi:MAG: DNA replication/repair protein RecF [Sphingomonadales bacterium]|nr:DNA replication/repair protein RecF [Sphingomonadales bacterium]
MALDSLRLTRFRNHAASELSGTGRFNLLTGENGAGKTNVLEAISLFAPGRGLRRGALAEMAMHHTAGGFAVSALLNRSDAAEPVRIGTGTQAQRPGRRLVRTNGAETAASALSEWLGLFWLTPAMDRLFVDGAAARRRFLDRLVLAIEPAHARNAARFEAALRERARLLFGDDEPGAGWLEAVEAQLAEAGSALAAARARLLAALDTALADLPPTPFARPRLGYQPGGSLDAGELAAALAAGRRRDRVAGRTLAGPHRDDLLVTHADKAQPAALCSTGEQKAMLIAITLAHCRLADGGDPQRPRILLLDEVAAHLDPLRREALFAALVQGPAQVWITGTEPEPFAAILDHAARWRVAEGAVERIG